MAVSGYVSYFIFSSNFDVYIEADSTLGDLSEELQRATTQTETKSIILFLTGQLFGCAPDSAKSATILSLTQQHHCAVLVTTRL